MKLLDPVTLAKLSNLHLRVKYVVEGLMSGLHASPYRGHSLEFSQHREYSFGDEIRHIDWKVYGRSDRFFVKQFQDESNLRTYMLLDSSASMSFSFLNRPSKLRYASEIAAALSYILIKQEDDVSLGVFDSILHSHLPAHHHPSHLSAIIETLDSTVPGGETSISSVLRGYGQYLKKRGMVILISDLMDEPSKVISELKSYRSRHNEVLVLQIVDPSELDFPFTGYRLFKDIETGEELSLHAEDISDEYRLNMAQFVEKYKTGFRSSGINYQLISTDIPLEIAVARALAC